MAKIKFRKQKKQFRLYDVYRYAATGTMSDIAGIVSYECNVDATVLIVRFNDIERVYPEGIAKTYFSRNEWELKQIVKEINQRLGNCLKPGRRRYK